MKIQYKNHAFKILWFHIKIWNNEKDNMYKMHRSFVLKFKRIWCRQYRSNATSTEIVLDK